MTNTVIQEHTVFVWGLAGVSSSHFLDGHPPSLPGCTLTCHTYDADQSLLTSELQKEVLQSRSMHPKRKTLEGNTKRKITTMKYLLHSIFSVL
jgi:hypothetical protein